MQGFNRYYPPDYDPRDPKHKGNLNRLAGKAAQKPVVRFEMPYNIWCLHCDSHIAQGVRFNAHKEKTGNYFSSPIFSFSMKCHLCTGTIVIATNPKDTCYDIVAGAKKKAEEWSAQENGTFDFDSSSTHIEQDPLCKLEKDATQRLNLKDSQTHITQLLRENERQWSDPYAQSQRLRRTFRSEKKVLQEAEKRRDAVKERHGLGLEVLDQSYLDRLAAKSIEYDHGPVGIVRGHNTSAGQSLRETVQSTTKLRNDPFSSPVSSMKRARKDENANQAMQQRQPENSEAEILSNRLVEYSSD